MDTVITDYVEVRGILLPDGTVPWRRFRTTKSPRVLIDDPHSSIQIVQRDNTGRERMRWGLPTRLVDQYGSPEHEPESEVRIITGTFPLYRPTAELAVEIDYGPLFEVDVPDVRPNFREPLTAFETDGGYRLTWEVEPGSREELVHDVLVSDDDGDTWRCVASDLEKTEVRLREDDLPEGSATLIAVESWDGFYTAVERGRIANLAEPELDVRILHPRRGQTHDPAPMLLEALTFVNGEIGPVPDQAISWYVDDTKVASGMRALWSGPGGGIHRVRVEVEYKNSKRSATTRVSVADVPGGGTDAGKTGT